MHIKELDVDAETEGLENRLISIATEIKQAMNLEAEPLTITNGLYFKLDDINFGAFVFTKPGDTKGRLEDTLLPLMRDKNEKIFECLAMMGGVAVGLDKGLEP